MKNKDKEIIPLIQGLFDSDGTVIPKRGTIKFSSTSKKIISEVILILEKFDIHAKQYKWLKNSKSKMLYEAVIKQKKSILKFDEVIGFQHPKKEKRLKTLCNRILLSSPVV